MLINGYIGLYTYILASAPFRKYKKNSDIEFLVLYITEKYMNINYLELSIELSFLTKRNVYYRQRLQKMILTNISLSHHCIVDSMQKIPLSLKTLHRRMQFN